ncbi:U-scoloptoxin(16)-Sm1a [Anabrus simplex]|uniref:U-scoloptoxin(16)-Sm1a n=1 Tax=Anabrus simplex TaxID=316456 RepID=UPI0035A2FD60
MSTMRLSILPVVCILLAQNRAVEVKEMPSLESYPVNPDFPGQCFVKKENKAYPVGSTWFPEGECSSHTCKEVKGTTAQIDVTLCDDVEAEKPCHVTRNKKLKFPKCCPKVECEGGKGAKNGS